MDFLCTPTMKDFLTSKAPPNFIPALSLLRAYTAYMKTTRFTQLVERIQFAQHAPSPFTSALRELLTHAKSLELIQLHDQNRNPNPNPTTAAAATHSMYKHLDDLDAHLPEMERKSQIRMNTLGNPSNTVLLVYRELVLSSCLVGYLSHTLRRLPRRRHSGEEEEEEDSYFAPFRNPALSDIINMMLMRRCGCNSSGGASDGGSIHHHQTGHAKAEAEAARLIRCLLEEGGCDPNEEYPVRSPLLSLSYAGGGGGGGGPGGTTMRTPWMDLVTWPQRAGCADGSYGFGDGKGEGEGKSLEATPKGPKRALLEELLTLMLKHGADREVWPGVGVDEVSEISYIAYISSTIRGWIEMGLISNSEADCGCTLGYRDGQPHLDVAGDNTEAEITVR